VVLTVDSNITGAADAAVDLAASSESLFSTCIVCCRVDRHKQVSISKKTASLCAADVTLKEFAQRVVDDFEL